MRPPVAEFAQLTHQRALGKTERLAKNLVPLLPYKLEQGGNVEVGRIIVAPGQLVAPTSRNRSNPVFAVVGLQFALDEGLHTLAQELHASADALVVADGHGLLLIVLTCCKATYIVRANMLYPHAPP